MQKLLSHRQLSASPLFNEWLTHQGSLTKKFEQFANQPLKVSQSFEGFQALSHSQSISLGISRKQMAWVRKVQLYGYDDTPWAVACSYFPISSLHGSARRLRHLGSTPLGYVLFARHKPTCTRKIVTSTSQIQPVFSRQNFYTWHGEHILVEETFLPLFMTRVNQQTDTGWMK